jgi:hypothetical protein
MRCVRRIWHLSEPVEVIIGKCYTDRNVIGGPGMSGTKGVKDNAIVLERLDQ